MTEVAERSKILEGLNTRFSSLNNSSDFHAIRQKAFDFINEKGLPHPKNEEYKFTNVTRILEKQFDISKKSGHAVGKSDVDALVFEGLDVIKLVFINGEFSLELSDIEETKGLKISSIGKAIESNDPQFLALFGEATKNNNDEFAALNTALVEDGSFITVADNSIIEKPIALFFINDATNDKNYTNSRNLISIGKNSQVDFLELFSTKGNNDSFTNIVTEILVDENAHGNYYKIQNNNDNASHIGTTQIHQKRSSVFSTYTFTLNGGTVRNNLNIAVDGEGCESHMYGLYVVNGKTHVDNHTAADHIRPHSMSNELYKGILEDNARGVFNGKVYVRQAAQKTNAFQSNKNILLSDTSTVNTKPQLEIWADDVKCSHGCTTGQLDEDALFYLRARGLSKTSARAMLLYAFAIEVIESVKLEPLKNYLEHIISERLHKDF
ncbi:Fe-S cluster assembly protein SufD [Fulvivirga lutimaris]|uniref:Fe-S cluster assembly protein SufD n=1 Tax=Fulvivirga lutimaris TaxID=1819566 RepID=UPI0012BC9E49|nr:Fe-S cluster assembly protein SufD [Fulvivirga lutimaris]MTI38644.1 Fe-S cluster assembly protein SufD [Fulvivirga lutimaris]